MVRYFLFDRFLGNCFGLRSIYWPNSISRSFFIPKFAMSEFLTRTSCRLGSLITFVVGLIFPTVLPRAITSNKTSRFFFWRWLLWILRAIFTWTLQSLLVIGRASPSDHMSSDSSSLIFSCNFVLDCLLRRPLFRFQYWNIRPCLPTALLSDRSARNCFFI